MSGCWVCTNRVVPTTNDEAVGCCKVCQVHACNNDGDRLAKTEFWCVVCLQWAVVDSSGLVTGTTARTAGGSGPGAATLGLRGDGDLFALAPRLRGRLEQELAGAEHMWSAAAGARSESDVPPGPGGRGVRIDLLRLATALAIQAVGSAGALVEGALREDRAAVLPMVHPALAEHIAVAGPMIA